MKVTPEQNAFFHKRLPIDENEVVISVYRHHPIAYIAPLLIALTMITVILGLAFALTSVTTTNGNAVVSQAYRQYVIGGVGFFCFLILVFSYIPIWIKTKDQLILTNESLIQILQTSLFSDKVSQLSLQHITDVTVKAGFWGNLLGYGHLTVETPGEQDNYEYGLLPNANAAAREISEVHERFIAALESGQLHYDIHGFSNPATRAPQTIMVDPAQYQAFLQYQQQMAENGQPASPPPDPPSQQQN